MSAAIAGYNAFRARNAIEDADTENAVVQKRLQNLKNRKSVTGKVKEITDDSGTISNVAKLAKSVLGFFATVFKHLPWIGTSAKVFADSADVIKLFATGKNIDDIAQNTKSPLKVASCTLDLASIGLTGAKLISATKAFDIVGKLSSAIGRIPVVGTVLAAWAPLGSIAAAVSIAKGAVDIAQSSRKIQTLKEDKTHLQEKKTGWQERAQLGITAEFKQQKVDSLTRKIGVTERVQGDLDTKANNASNRMQEADQAAEDAKTAARGRNPLKVFKKIHAFRKEHQAKKAARAFDAAVRAANQNEARRNVLNNDRANWTNLDLDDEDQRNDLVRPLAERKVEKYDVKLKNNRWNIGKEAVNISLNTVLIIASIASIVFTGLLIASGVGVIALAVAFFAVSAIGITLHFLKKRQDQATEKVGFTEDIPAPVPVLGRAASSSHHSVEASASVEEGTAV
ncbi:MAG: hypothetical protein ACK5MA_06760 [Parachlamydiaceae bacterium]